MVDAFTFLKSATKGTPKMTMPAPSELHFFGGRDVIDRKTYPDLEEFWSDLAAIYRAEIADLAKAGCTYFQLDNCSFPLLCDPKFQAAFKAIGEDPETLIDGYIGVINAVLKDKPANATFGMHLCRGNNRGKWLGEGGYDYVASMVFERVDVDAFFLEYDTPRAGDFSPLKACAEGQACGARPRLLETARAGIGGEPERPHQGSREVTSRSTSFACRRNAASPRISSAIRSPSPTRRPSCAASSRWRTRSGIRAAP